MKTTIDYDSIDVISSRQLKLYDTVYSLLYHHGDNYLLPFVRTNRNAQLCTAIDITGKVIGCMMIKRDSYVYNIVVLPKHRGKHIAVNLLNRYLKWGCYYAYVREDNEPMLNLFKKHFVSKVADKKMRRDGKMICKIYFRKRVKGVDYL